MNRFPTFQQGFRHALAAAVLCWAAAAHGAWEWAGPYGRVASWSAGYLQRLTGYQAADERLDLELEERLQASEKLDGKLVLWSTLLAPHRQAGDLEETKVLLEAKEGWVGASWTDWDLRLGNQIFTWGRTDGFNPVDRLNPRDYYDLLSSPKLPVTAARINVHPEKLEGWNLELVGTPLFRESRPPLGLPGAGSEAFGPEGSRWLVSLPSAIDAGGILTPIEYEAFNASYPDSWTAGARITTRAPMDLGLTYINGVETEPRIAVTQIGAPSLPGVPITMELHPSFHRYQLLGLDGATVIPLGNEQELGFRFEGAYTWRDNSRAEAASASLRQDLIKDDFLHVISGFDYRPSGRVLGAEWYFNLQYSFYQRFGDREAAVDADLSSSLPTVVPWDRDVILFTQANFSSLFNFSQTLIWSHRRGDAVFRPEVRSEWTEKFSTKLGMDLFLGDSRGFFGQFTENRRVLLTAEFVF